MARAKCWPSRRQWRTARKADRVSLRCCIALIGSLTNNQTQIKLREDSRQIHGRNGRGTHGLCGKGPPRSGRRDKTTGENPSRARAPTIILHTQTSTLTHSHTPQPHTHAETKRRAHARTQRHWRNFFFFFPFWTRKFFCFFFYFPRWWGIERNLSTSATVAHRSPIQFLFYLFQFLARKIQKWVWQIQRVAMVDGRCWCDRGHDQDATVASRRGGPCGCCWPTPSIGRSSSIRRRRRRRR